MSPSAGNCSRHWRTSTASISGAEDALLFAGVGDDVAVRADDDAAAVVGEVGIGAAAVHADDEGEVLDGAGLQEREPVVVAFDRPARDDDEEFRAELHGGAEVLGETQVVADERERP